MARTGGGKLSAMAVAKAAGPAVLHDGGGLYLRASPTGAKKWVFRFQLEGRRRDMGLGPYPDVSLADARRIGELLCRYGPQDVGMPHVRPPARSARDCGKCGCAT